MLTPKRTKVAGTLSISVFVILRCKSWWASFSLQSIRSSAWLSPVSLQTHFFSLVFQFTWKKKGRNVKRCAWTLLLWFSTLAVSLQTSRLEKNNTRGNGGRVRGVENWRVDCFSKTANLELCNWKNISCQNTVLTEFRVLSVVAKYPSQKDVSKRGRRGPLPYARHSQHSGRIAQSFRSGGVCLLSGAPSALLPKPNPRRGRQGQRGLGRCVRMSYFSDLPRFWFTFM